MAKGTACFDTHRYSRHMHGNPSDRLVVATALECHTLVTADGPILEWPGNVNRLDARE